VVVEVKDYDILWRISRLVDTGAFGKLGYTADEFFRYLIDNFDQGEIKVFAYIKDKKIVGFVVCSVSENLISGEKEVFIDLAWVDRHADGKVGKDLLKKVEVYTRGLNLKKISGYTTLTKERAILRKYGFKNEAIIMSKVLEEGGKNGTAEEEES